MELRNLPEEEALPFASLVACHPGQVSSMSLVRGGFELGLSATLFAFAAGESVSEERYEGDTLYLCVEGRMALMRPDGWRAELSAGDVLRVPACVEHAVEGVGEPFKMLQVTVPANV